MSPAGTARAATSAPRPRGLFLLALAAAVPISVTLGILNQPLQNATSPQGVVSLELAGSLQRQAAVLASWQEPEKLRLAFSIGLDFACVATFLTTLALPCLWLAGAGGGFGAKLGRALYRVVLVMGAFWTVQNILLAAALFGHGTALAAQAIYGCALVKFTAMGAASLYIVLRGGMLVLFPTRGRNT